MRSKKKDFLRGIKLNCKSIETVLPNSMLKLTETEVCVCVCVCAKNSAISHASPAEKTKVQLTWEAPSNSNYGDIYFRYVSRY